MIKKEKYLSAIMAFILWSSWAYFVNIDDENRFVSSFFQGIISFILTLFMIRFIIIFSKIFINSSIYTIATLTVMVTSSIVFIGHLLINTQNIFYTICPTIIVAFVFSIFIVKKYQQSINKEDNEDILILFAEGSRGKLEQMARLKKGLFYLLKDRKNIPIIPVAMQGLGNSLPKGEALFVPFNCQVSIGEAISIPDNSQILNENLKSFFESNLKIN